MEKLPGIEILDIKKNVDERGFFAEAMRDDWREFLKGDHALQANLSMSYPGIIRAWHRHQRGQVDCFMVMKGVMKICAYDDRPNSPTEGWLTEVVGSGERLQLIRIPGEYWHGTKTLGNEASLTIYFTTRLYDYANPDEERRPWNDPKVIDPLTKKPFDWNKSPYK